MSEFEPQTVQAPIIDIPTVEQEEGTEGAMTGGPEESVHDNGASDEDLEDGEGPDEDGVEVEQVEDGDIEGTGDGTEPETL